MGRIIVADDRTSIDTARRQARDDEERRRHLDEIRRHLSEVKTIDSRRQPKVRAILNASGRPVTPDVIENGVEEFASFIANLEESNIYRGAETINLSPSENTMSRWAKWALVSDMRARYFFDDPLSAGGPVFGPKGVGFIRKTVNKTSEILQELTGGSGVELGVVSGHIADVTALVKCCGPQDTYMVVDPRHGGYGGFAPGKIPKLFSRPNVKYLPFTSEGLLDVVAAKREIVKCKPRLVLLGSSVEPFPYPTKELAETIRRESPQTILAYDISHPMGLIFGKKYPNPLAEGADVIFGGTNKSFYGLQGGLWVYGNKSAMKKLLVEPLEIADNTQLNRIAALGCSLIEMKAFGEAYAGQTIKNAKHLAMRLDGGGIPIRFKDRGYTASHQILVDIKKQDQYQIFVDIAEKAGIIMDPSGRIGTQELTRRGMCEKEMEEIADYLIKVWEIASKDTALEAKHAEAVKLRKDTKAFMAPYHRVEYSFDERIPRDFLTLVRAKHALENAGLLD
jgi:glycine hydroxymethyltransferase